MIYAHSAAQSHEKLQTKNRTFICQKRFCHGIVFFIYVLQYFERQLIALHKKLFLREKSPVLFEISQPLFQMNVNMCLGNILNCYNLYVGNYQFWQLSYWKLSCYLANAPTCKNWSKVKLSNTIFVLLYF